MSTICIPLLFSQKTQDLKPHNMLNNHSQISAASFPAAHTAADKQPLKRAAAIELPRQSSGDATAAVLPHISHSQEGNSQPEVTDQSQASEHEHAAANSAA